MEVEIIAVGGPLCKITADLTWRVGDLRSAVAEETGIPVSEQILLVGSVELARTEALLTEAIPEDSTTILCIQDRWCVIEYFSGGLDGTAYRYLDGKAFGMTSQDLERAFPGCACAYGLSIEEAKRHCAGNPGVWGFTYQCLESPDKPVWVHFKHVGSYISRQRGFSTGCTYVRYSPEGRQALLDIVRRVRTSGGDKRTFIEPITDLETVLAILQEDHRVFRFVCAELRSNAEVAQLVVAVDGLALQHAGDALKGNRHIVSTALRQNPYALQHAAPALRADHGMVGIATEIQPLAIRYASDTLLADRDLCLRCVRRDPYALKHVGAQCKDDREIVIAAVSQAPDSLNYASAFLRSDKEVLDIAWSGGYVFGDRV